MEDEKLNFGNLPNSLERETEQSNGYEINDKDELKMETIGVQSTDILQLGRTHPCPYCNYFGTEKQYLTRHIRNQHLTRPYKCPGCDFRAAFKYFLKRHIATVHRDGKLYKKRSLSDTTKQLVRHNGIFACSFCDFKAQSDVSLASHVSLHIMEKGHVCSVCGYLTSKRYRLKVHMRKHSGEKPFKCEYCQFEATEAYLVKRHWKNRHLFLPLEVELNG